MIDYMILWHCASNQSWAFQTTHLLTWFMSRPLRFNASRETVHLDEDLLASCYRCQLLTHTPTQCQARSHLTRCCVKYFNQSFGSIVSIFSVNLICFCCRYDRYDYHNASLLPALVNIEPTYLALFNVKTGADRLVGNTYRQWLGCCCGQIQRSTMFPSQKKIIIWLRSGGCSGGCRELQRVPAGRPRPWTRFAAFLLVCTKAEKSSFRWHIHIYVDLSPSIIIVIMIIASNNGLWWYRRTTGSVAPRRSRVALNVWDV